MRRIRYLICVMALLAGLWGCAQAQEPEGAADTLYGLGLFQGTESGYQLDLQATREQAVTMLVRLLGREEIALAGGRECPFDDVSDWAVPYVAYAYEQGLAEGLGGRRFGGRSTVTSAQYLTLLLRSLGYASGEQGDFTWSAAAEFVAGVGLTGNWNASDSFLRGDMVTLSLNALQTRLKDGTDTLLDQLVNEGAVRREVAEQAGLLEPLPEPLWEGTRLLLPAEDPASALRRGVPEARYLFHLWVTYYDYSDPFFAAAYGGTAPGWTQMSNISSFFLDRVYQCWNGGRCNVDLAEPGESVFLPQPFKMEGVSNSSAGTTSPEGVTTIIPVPYEVYYYDLVTDGQYRILGLIRSAEEGQDLWLESDLTAEENYTGEILDPEIGLRMWTELEKGARQLPELSLGRLRQQLGSPEEKWFYPIETNTDLTGVRASLILTGDQSKEDMERDIQREYLINSLLDKEALWSRSLEALYFEKGVWGVRYHHVNYTGSFYVCYVDRTGNPIGYSIHAGDQR